MRIIVACCLSVLAGSAVGQQPYLDGNLLYERLLKREASATTYILGVFDTVQILQYHAPRVERFVCPPLSVTDQDLADAVLKHLQLDGATHSFPAGVLVLAALTVTFPCEDINAAMEPASATLR